MPVRFPSAARAASAASAAKRGRAGSLAIRPTPVNRRLYADVDPTASPDFVTKTGLRPT
jgi:TldD protein